MHRALPTTASARSQTAATPFLQSSLATVQGTATYEGAAVGVYSDETGGSTEIGYLDGDVTLSADFGDRNSLGTISGSITNFQVDGVPAAGRLNLGAADIGSQHSGFFEGAVTGSDNERAYTGHWGGQFFGNGGIGRQTRIGRRDIRRTLHGRCRELRRCLRGTQAVALAAALQAN